MEDSAKFINDSFVDFAGKTHYFTVVATSTNNIGTFAINDVDGDYYPIEKEILSYVLNNEKSSKIREKVN